MGKLVSGQWHDVWYDTASTKGAFLRDASAFRRRVTADGSSGFGAESGRYHLYVSRACPWAHRTLIFRALKGLEDAISISVTHPHMGKDGWTFDEAPGTIPDTVNDARALHEIYTLAKPDYTGRVTVPVLWDKRERTIVNNESSEIIRMLNREFDAFATRAQPDLYPADLAADIDALNDVIYRSVNDGVYRAGFATSQAQYEAAFDALFATLDDLERRLSEGPFLFGDRLTEADWRLFTTLLRFDAVYYGHFKCNLRRLVDYPRLWRYARELYRVPGVAETVNFDHIKKHYYGSHRTINPTGIVPKGPLVGFDEGSG
jgi:putative glutathione S-transferase